MGHKIKPKRHGKPAERAAYMLSYYFKQMANDRLSDDSVVEITGIIEDIIEAAVDEAIGKAVNKFVSIEGAGR